MSGFPNMNEWERFWKPTRDHIDDQLLTENPDADTWHWGILPDEESEKGTEAQSKPINQ